MASLLRPQALLRACPQRCAFAPVRPAFAPVSRPVAQRGTLVVMAAEDKKDQKKKTPSPVKRAMLAQERRKYNKSHKSACATRIKKVIKLSQALVASPPQSEEEVKGLEKLISEAFKEIDKAVGKGIIHENTGARKKARCARWKKQVLMTAGLYQPAPESSDFARYQRILAAKEKAIQVALAAKEKAAQVAQAAKEKAAQVAQASKGRAAQVAQAAKEKAPQVAQAAKEKAPQVAQAAKGKAPQVAQAAKGKAPQAKPAA